MENEHFRELVRIAGESVVPEQLRERATPELVSGFLILKANDMRAKMDDMGAMMVSLIAGLLADGGKSATADKEAEDLLEIGGATLDEIVKKARANLYNNAGYSIAAGVYGRVIAASTQIELEMDAMIKEAKEGNSENLDDMMDRVEEFSERVMKFGSDVFDSITDPDILDLELYRSGRTVLQGVIPYSVIATADIIQRILMLINFHGLVLTDEQAAEYRDLRENGVFYAGITDSAKDFIAGIGDKLGRSTED